MRILDRYILSSIIKIFVLTVIVFCLLYILIDTTNGLDDLIERKVSLGLLLFYYTNLLPLIFVQTSSTATLVAILLTFSHLNATNEAIAMRSSGMNFWQLTKPAVFFGLLVSVFVFWVNEQIVPQAYLMTKEIRDEKLLSLKKVEWKRQERVNNLTFYGLQNRLYFIERYDPEAETLHGITIIEFDENQDIQQKVVALSGTWTGIAWKFYNCQISVFDPNSPRTPVKFYKEKLMDIKDGPKDLLKQRLNVASMNFRQLAQYIDRFSTSGAVRAINNLRVDLHGKISYPMSNFVIAFTGLPFALMIRSRKRSSFAAIGAAMAIGFLYYVLTAVCLAFGKGGLFPPIVAAWSAPLVTILIGLIVIERNF
ncbi:MAG TPA: LptF/LptG family permease [Candidatus Omnitrophota bacterium]|nr:LptF/LptG family permease [Candidatus Omnitrophota bacterium]